MIIEQPAKWLRWLYPRATWRMDKNERAVYLTFDDGPIPESTPFILDTLAEYDARATFFMVGDNVRKHPGLFKQIVDAGHQVGNHTFNHIRGFENTFKSYQSNTDRAQQFMREACGDLPAQTLEHALQPLLFRPPHGHMTWSQYLMLKKHYRIVMWDLVTRDYSKKLRGPQVLANVMRYARNGSIITFHDSLKSWNNDNLAYALPRSLDFLKEEGYEFKLR